MNENDDFSFVPDERMRTVRRYGFDQNMSERLPVRLVDEYCRGIQVPLRGKQFKYTPKDNADVERIFQSKQLKTGDSFAAASSARPLNLQNDGGLGELGVNMGAPLPLGNTEVIGDFTRPADINFFSVDWSGDWLELVDENRVNSFQEINSTRLSDIIEVSS